MSSAKDIEFSLAIIEDEDGILINSILMDDLLKEGCLLDDATMLKSYNIPAISSNPLIVSLSIDTSGKEALSKNGDLADASSSEEDVGVLAKTNHHGFENPLFMCYLNASLQALLAAVPFRNFLADIGIKKGEEHLAIRRALKNLAKCMRRDVDISGEIVVSQSIKTIGSNLAQSIFKLNAEIQHDAHEFIDLLVEFLQPEPNMLGNFNELFSVETSYSETLCPCCRENIAPWGTEEHIIYRLSMIDAKADQTIQSILDENLSVVFSGRCCQKDILCKSQINKLPKVLLVGLLRYSSDETKIETPVEVSSDLVLAQYRVPPEAMERSDYSDVTYKLSGIVNHFGTTLNSGHYTCYIFDTIDQVWLLCDDERIKVVDQCEAVSDSSRSCYLLVYTKLE